MKWGVNKQEPDTSPSNSAHERYKQFLSTFPDGTITQPPVFEHIDGQGFHPVDRDSQTIYFESPAGLGTLDFNYRNENWVHTVGGQSAEGETLDDLYAHLEKFKKDK